MTEQHSFGVAEGFFGGTCTGDLSSGGAPGESAAGVFLKTKEQLMCCEEGHDTPAATSRTLEAAVAPRPSFTEKKYNNGFILYETITEFRAETDQLCKLREMAGAVRRRRLVTRAITYVALTIVIVLVLVMELAMKSL